MITETDCNKLVDKISSIALNASVELNDELYPQKLGEKVMMQSPELRLTIISKYEGIATILKSLSPIIESDILKANVTRLEINIEKELSKISI